MIADVHGDFPALQDALAQLARLDVAEVVCAGDLLDWGPAPERTIELLRQNRIPCVRGNHDFVDGEGRDLEGKLLTDRAIAYLETLPRSWRRRIAGVRVGVWHARPRDLMKGIDPDRVDVPEVLQDTDADVLIVGHTHVPMHLTAPQGLIVNPGSVLRETSADIPASGTFGVLDLPTRRFSIHRASDGVEIGP